MKRYETLLSALVCLIVGAGALYHYLDRQHTLTEVSLEIPQKRKQLSAIQDENIRLRFELDQLENPAHLLQLARSAPFRHLRHPLRNEITLIERSSPLLSQPLINEDFSSPSYTPFVIGAKRLSSP